MPALGGAGHHHGTDIPERLRRLLATYLASLSSCRS